MTSQDTLFPVEIRPLGIDDLEIFRDIRAEAIERYAQSFGSVEEDQGCEVMMTAYRRWLNSDVLGAFEQEHLVGVAGFYVGPDRRSRHRVQVFTVYVKENRRGNGIGDRLIKELLALAATRVEQIHLALVVTATAAIETYRRNGFEVYGLDPRAIRIGDTTYDKYLMVKTFNRCTLPAAFGTGMANAKTIADFTGAKLEEMSEQIAGNYCPLAAEQASDTLLGKGTVEAIKATAAFLKEQKKVDALLPTYEATVTAEFVKAAAASN